MTKRERHIVGQIPGRQFYRICWEPCGRKPWRIGLRNDDWLRDLPSKAFPAGRPLEFDNPREAIDFIVNIKQKESA